MKIKEKSVRSKLIIIVIILIIVSSLAVLATQVSALIVHSSIAKEIFKDDAHMLNSEEVPTHLFAEQGHTLFCIEHGTDLDGWLGVGDDPGDEEKEGAYTIHYKNYMAKVEGAIGYSETNPMWFYRRPGEPGLVINHRDKHSAFVNSIPNYRVSNDPYEGDDQALIDSLEATLPGIGTPRLTSINFQVAGSWSSGPNQDAAYILSNYPQYSAWDHPKEDEGVDYSLRTLQCYG